MPIIQHDQPVFHARIICYSGHPPQSIDDGHSGGAVGLELVVPRDPEDACEFHAFADEPGGELGDVGALADAALMSVLWLRGLGRKEREIRS